MRLPADRARRPPLPGPRLRGAAAHQPRVPGVDRAQRLRPRHHADRAVRVDDGDDDLPAQPRAGQAPRRAARAARDPARRPDRRAHAAALPARARPPTEPVDDRRRRRPRSARCAPRPRSRSSSRSTRTSRSRPPRPAAYVVAARRQVQRRRRRRRRRRSPQGADQLPFGGPPQVGDALLPRLRGADSARLIMQVDMEASTARGAGVDPEDPPLRWEVSGGRRQVGRRRRCSRTSPAASTTAPARSSCSCPPRSADRAARRQAAALAALPDRRQDARRRARRPTRTRPRSTRSPPRRSARCCPASHSARAESEMLGVVRRHARPGRSALRNAPVLKPRAGRDARGPGPGVRRLGALGAARELRRARPSSTATSTLDVVSGEIELGPAIRETRRRLVAVRRGARRRARSLRFTPLPPRRRARGQRRGRHALNVLRSPIPGVDTVTNPEPAIGGVDAEPLEHARQRAAMEIRTRYRAVTAEDFEFLAGEASPRVARAVCLPPQRRRAGPAAHRPARLSRRPPAPPTRSSCPTTQLLQRGRASTSTRGA